MANEPEEEHLHDADAEEGGPIKSFLEHLEDLRWMLIKCCAAIALGVLVCLLAGNHVVAILMRPLEKARISYPGTNQVMVVMFGTNRLGTYSMNLDQWDVLTGGTNGNPFLFSPSNILDFKSLVTRLKEPSKKDLVSQYVTNDLSPDTYRLLTNYPTGFQAFLETAFMFFHKSSTNDADAIESRLRPALTDDLNRILQSNHIYSAERFGNDLTPETMSLVALNPSSGPDLARLNRKLLLQAFPELRKRFVAVELLPRNDGSNVTLGLRINPAVNAQEVAERMKTSINAFGPAKAFLVGFHVALYAGVALASPAVIYFLGSFIFPALKIRERKYIWLGTLYAVPLFLSGILFCYFILMPAALAASQVYSDWFGFSSDFWDAGDYIGFVSKFMLGMGLGFELPVVVLILVKIGLLSYQTLRKARPYMIVINLVLGAVLTTPEVFTQVLMAIPLQVLFEISVWVAWYWERKERKQREREEAGIKGTD